jgi:methyl-accepting chemotaxis protein
MRTLPRIILGATVPILVGAIFTSYFSIYQQVSCARSGLIAQYQDTANLLAKEVEVGYYESKWPFENLASLTQKSDFQFWWIIDESGHIYLSNDSAYMGTDAASYFPQINRQPDQEGFVSAGRNGGGVYFKNFEAGQKQWSFWLGFSLASLNQIIQRIVLVNVLVALVSFLVIAVALYFIIRQAMSPLDDLVRGTRTIAEGKLDHRIDTQGGGEFGYLATAFNSMAEKVQGQYRELEAKVKERTAELEKASAQLAVEKKSALEKAGELERVNAVMIGRELKMVDLKGENDALKKQLGDKL